MALVRVSEISETLLSAARAVIQSETPPLDKLGLSVGGRCFRTRSLRTGRSATSRDRRRTTSRISACQSRTERRSVEKSLITILPSRSAARRAQALSSRPTKVGLLTRTGRLPLSTQRRPRAHSDQCCNREKCSKRADAGCSLQVLASRGLVPYADIQLAAKLGLCHALRWSIHSPSQSFHRTRTLSRQTWFSPCPIVSKPSQNTSRDTGEVRTPAAPAAFDEFSARAVEICRKDPKDSVAKSLRVDALLAEPQARSGPTHGPDPAGL